MRTALFATLLMLPLSLFGQELDQDMVTKMDALISATEKSLVSQKEIRDLLMQYKEVEKKAIVDPDNTDNLLKLLLLAKELHESIQKGYLEEYFPPQFLQELDKLAALYDKRSIPPAK